MFKIVNIIGKRRSGIGRNVMLEKLLELKWSAKIRKRK